MADETTEAQAEGESPADEDFREQYPGFTITCDRCGSIRVYVSNSMGSSPESGKWGSIDLVCDDCENETSIVGPY